MLRPATPEEAASALRDAGRPLRPRGGATKLGWGARGDAAEELDTRGLDRILEHNAGDFTVIAQAGVALRDLQEALAAENQTFMLDPPDGDGAATLGGVLASGDSGPLRHRYGAARDLVIGMTVALSDGTLAKSGGRVIKNVAGYDLAKLFCGSMGTLGLIVQVALRLHPDPGATATARIEDDDPARLAARAAELIARPLEADCLDVSWRDGRGALLVRFSGAAAERQAQAVEGAETITGDGELWAAQRAAQRSADRAVLKVSGRPSDLEALLRAAEAAGAGVVARAGLGLAWVSVDGDRAAALRDALSPRPCVLLDRPDGLELDPWPAPDPGALTVMRRLKARFDPAGVMRPGAFVGGI